MNDQAPLPPPPVLTGHVVLELDGGWALEECFLTLPNGCRPLVESLVSPNGRHAWARFPRLPRFWLYVDPH